MKTFSFAMMHGKVITEPEFKTLKNGSCVCNFSLCVKNNRKTEDLDKIYEFFNVRVWEKLTDVIRKYVKKGDFLEIVGRLKQERWHDRNDKPKSKISLIAERIGFLSYNKKEDSQKTNQFSQ